MSIFQSRIPPKTVVKSRHPWESRIKAKYSNSYKHAHNSVTNPIYPVPKTGKEKLEENKKNKRIKFTVIGNRVTKEFIYCLYLVKGLHKTKQKWFEAPVIRGVTGVEWPKVWKDLKLQYGGPVYCLKSQVAVLKNEEFLGGESELKYFVEDKYVYNVYLDYHKEGIQQFANFIKSSGRPCVYMHISINNEPAGCLIFMLYVDVAPLTCQNFMKMCHTTRGGYSGSPIHRIVQDCWIQCGGFILKNSDPIRCENYTVPHDRRGVLGMANSGRHTDCSTQFFVLLQPAPWMNNRYVAFGQLIEGEGTLSKIESVTTWYESPISDIVIDSAGILNMDCQRIPINRGVLEYIERHTEDLVALGRFFFELILDKVFNIIKFRILERLAKIESGEIEEEEKPVRKTERVIRKKEIQQNDDQNVPSDENTENNDFDVDEYEYEDMMYIHKSITPVPSSVATPTELYYLPLTDVPYPGEVDSIYDLKKLLRGDYCLESDLKKTSSKAEDKPFLYKIPQTTIDTLFDYLTIDLDMSDTSLSQEDEDIVKLYLLENNDTVSFAGRIVTQMANFSEKLRLFDGTITEKSNRDVLTDEDLRLISMIHKELTTSRKKNVSLSVPETQLPHGLVRRRQTGYVHPEDVAYLLGENSEQDDDDDDDGDENLPSTDAARHVSTRISQKRDSRVHLFYPGDSGSSYSKNSQKIQDDIRKVKIASSTNLQHIPNRMSNLHSNLDFEEEHEVRRTSLLKRLYDEIDANGDDNVAPTLKNYKPLTEPHAKSYMLTTSHFDIPPDNEREKFLRHINAEDDNSIDHILQLQHGKKVFRKISSDYVRTIDQFEHLPANSIRSIEYSKKRPAITVDEYQRMNREHEEQMKTTQDKTTDTDDPQNSNN